MKKKVMSLIYLILKLRCTKYLWERKERMIDKRHATAYVRCGRVIFKDLNIFLFMNLQTSFNEIVLYIVVERQEETNIFHANWSQCYINNYFLKLNSGGLYNLLLNVKHDSQRRSNCMTLELLAYNKAIVYLYT